MLLVLTVIHILVCLFLILVVLLQQGKGADLSVFGGGGTQAAFGARGATTILHKLTVGAFVAFIVTTMGIGFLRSGQTSSTVMGGVDEPAASEPAEPAAAEEAPPVDLEGEATEGMAPTEGDAATPGDEAGGGEDLEPGESSPQ